MPNKRIVFVANTSWSIYRFRLHLLKNLTQRGFDVFVLAPRDAYSAQFEHLPGVVFIPLHCFENKRLSVVGDYRLYRELLGHYKTIAPDVVFHYTIKANIFGSLAARKCGVRSISVVTGLGYAFLHDALLRLVARTLYRFALKKASAVWLLNHDDREIFVSSRMADASQCFLLPGEGVDAEYFYPSPFDTTASRPIRFLLVGRVMTHKGIHEFVDAARLLKARGLNVVCQLLGTLEEQSSIAVSLKEIEGWRAEGVVDYLGATDDVRPAIAAADCVVLPSYREGLPLSLLEAASMCKALVATDVAGCREVVVDGENGFLCAVQNATDLANKMAAYFHLSASEKRAMGLRGRQLVLDHFTNERVASIYLEQLMRLLPSSPVTAPAVKGPLNSLTP